MLFNNCYCKLCKNPFVPGVRWGKASLSAEHRNIKWFEIRNSLLAGSPVVHLRSSTAAPRHTSTHVALRCAQLWTTTSPVCGVCRTISLRLTGLQSQRLRGFGKKSFFFHKHWKIWRGSGDFGFANIRARCWKQFYKRRKIMIDLYEHSKEILCQ